MYTCKKNRRVLMTRRVEQGGFTSGRLGNCSSKWFLDVKPEAVGPCFNVHFTTSVLHRGTGDNARATQFLVPGGQVSRHANHQTDRADGRDTQASCGRPG